MNIIYKLTNKSKSTFPKYYIGCKADCALTVIDGVNTIMNTVTNRPYYGSSLNKIFTEDLKNGHIFEAEILEVVPKKEQLMDVESKWLKHIDASNSIEYYNLSNGFEGLSKPDKVINIYGEVLKDYAMRQSNFSKKRNNAKELGFNSILDFSLFVYSRRIENKNWAEIAYELNKHRHFVLTYFKNINLNKVIDEQQVQNLDIKEQCSTMFSKGCSIYKISEILNLELPTVESYLSLELDLKENKSSAFLVAKSKGYTSDQFTDIICKDIASGLSIKDVALKHGLNIKAVYRYVERLISKLYSNNTFNISDIK